MSLLGRSEVITIAQILRRERGAGQNMAAAAASSARVERWISPPQRSVLQGHDRRVIGEIRLWDLRPSVPDMAVTTSLQHTLRGHPHWVNAVTFSPDGRTLASGDSNQGQIRLWDLTVRRVLPAPWTNQRAKWDAHQGHVIDLTFSPDGHTLASGGADCAVKLWKVVY
jgi:hypothetical protein